MRIASRLRSLAAATRNVGRRVLIGCSLAALSLPAAALKPAPPPLLPAFGIVAKHLDPDYWIGLQTEPDRVLLDREAIVEQNARMRRLGPGIHDLSPSRIPHDAADIRQLINARSRLPEQRFDSLGAAIDARTLATWRDNLALDTIVSQPPRYALVVRRANLRTFPTTRRVFSAPGGTDVDRFQETALFPGTPVAALHRSRDGHWWFVVSERYAAWIEDTDIAFGDADEVLRHAREQPPYLVVTGARAHTVFTPEQPDVSRLSLDMGVRLPLVANAQSPVNGQLPYAAYTVSLPVRRDDGTLQRVPALIARSEDVRGGYLPLTPRNLLAQSFKYLGERYGWGDSYDGRDCSGFVAQVYASFGVLLPRNTSDQARSAALDTLTFDPSRPKAERLAAVRDTHVGDLIHVPGHVMMVIGHADGMTWVIHDTLGVSYRDARGDLARLPLNGVSVTPLEPMQFNAEHSYIDRITHIQRIRR